MKITFYTTTNCQFSKQEREYLVSKGLQFEEKNLDTNKEFLTEMMTVGNNFAGTPVTKVEKDDGTIVVLKGFTKEELDIALGFAPEVKPEAEKPQETQPAGTPQVEAPAAPAETPPMADATPAAPQTEAPAATPQEPPIAEVLNQLQDKMKSDQPAETTPAIPTVESPAAAPTAPVTPPMGNDALAIPDFPVDAATQPAK